MLWGVKSKTTNIKSFLRNFRPGDILWFVLRGSGGQIGYMAELTFNRPRELGPLISVTSTNEELGWIEIEGDWDTEVHYKKLYDLRKLNILTGIKGQAGVRKFNAEKCSANLPLEYVNIVRYSQATKIER